jgi:glutaredoxin 2
MALGYLNLSYESRVLPYHDEQTPVALTGKKMLPIAVIDGKAQNESLDIIKGLDVRGQLNWSPASELQEFEQNVLAPIGSLVHSLAMPHWIWTPEFDTKSRQYFQSKKELKRGPFAALERQWEKFASELNTFLHNHPELLRLQGENGKLSIKEIMLAAHLWGCYIVPEFQFAPEWHNYLQQIKKRTKFNYLKIFQEQE